jgi:hypothetical protein
MANNNKRNKGLIVVSMFFLLMTLVPSILVFAGVITSDLNNILMLCGTIGWFVTAPYWMNASKKDEVTS